MIAGKKPKPKVMCNLEGKKSNSMFLDLDHPKPEQCMPDLPEVLHGDDIAIEKYNTYGAQLERLGLLTEIDADSLGLYCKAYANWYRAEKQLMVDGITILCGKDKTKKKHPACQVSKDAFDVMNRIGSQFGWTPATRMRLSVSDTSKGTDNPFDELLTT